MLGKHDLEGAAMMQLEYRVGTHELLHEECWRADFAGRVFDGGFVDAGAGVVSCRGRGQLGEVDGLCLSAVSCLGGCGSGSGSGTYCQDPPAFFQLMQDDARLLRLHRVYGCTIGEAVRKAHHALSQSDLAQLLILLLAQLLLRLCVCIAELGACLCSLGVVEDDLLVECLVAGAQCWVVHCEKGQLRRNNLGDIRRRHSLPASYVCLGTIHFLAQVGALRHPRVYRVSTSRGIIFGGNAMVGLLAI